MKIDRRTFIEITVGVALGAGAGITHSPLPWKLTDDISIWTQNWPWTPVPEAGAATTADTVCNLCPGGCGITVRKVGERATKIEGRDGYPVNDGGICPLGASGLQYVYGPYRVKSPVRRAGQRGAGAWEAVSWEEGIATVVEKLKALRSQGEAHKVACFLGSDRGTVPQLFNRFMTAYGSPNVIRTASGEDTSELAVKFAMGEKGSVGYDLENADFILSFGSGLIEGWGSPVRVIQAHSTWRSSGAKVVQVEPRLSNTAAKADMWVPITPGTETDLAMAIAHVIIQDGLYDKRVTGSTGFNQWRDLVLSDYDPATVSENTGISNSKIIELARAFANAKRPLSVWGKGKSNTSGSIYECMAVHALNALVGNINGPGGMTTLPEMAVKAWPGIQMDGAAQRGNATTRLDAAGSQDYPMTRYRPDELPGVLNENPDAIEVLLVHEADPLYTIMDSMAMAEAFNAIPMVVSFSSNLLNETASHADLILPDHYALERYEDVPTPRGFHKPILGLRKPVLEPQHDTQYAGDTVMAIAKGIGGSVAGAFPWDDYESLLQETLGDYWDTLEEQGYVEDPNYRPAASPFRFYAKASDPIEAEGDAIDYPLTLIPVDLIRLPSDTVGSPPFCTKTVEESELKGNYLVVQVNPKTAFDYGLAEDRQALLETPKGEATVLVDLSEGIMPGVVGLPKGLGHAGDDAYLAEKGISANSLMGVVEDPISGLCATWGIRAKLTSV